MNPQLTKLYDIAAKPSRLIIGLMSGTSLDGLDIALCRFSGAGQRTRFELLDFESIPYQKSFTDLIRQVFAKRSIDQQLLCGLHAHIGDVHAALVNSILRKWKLPANEIDLIASHGQTVYHAPQSFTNDPSFPNSTLQIGDGDHISMKTGIVTISDFRQKHLAAGGEGAPLVVYGDRLLFSSGSENRLLLNIGGISNFTLLPKAGSPNPVMATDVGPGNTLLNQYMARSFGLEMDRDATFAKQGTPSHRLVQQLLQHPFLAQDFPKTTGPELFNLAYLNSACHVAGGSNLCHADILASLCLFSAKAIAQAILRTTRSLQDEAVTVYVSGGGLHNPLLMEMLRAELPNIRIFSFAALGIDPDAKEACLFAALANETVAGNPDNVQDISGAPSVCMGKISLPY